MQLTKGSNYTCLGEWVAGSDSDDRANLSSTATEVGLPTWTELGNSKQCLVVLLSSVKYIVNVEQCPHPNKVCAVSPPPSICFLSMLCGVPTQFVPLVKKICIY